MKVILTLQTLNFAELCVPFPCIDSCIYEIEWRCAFTKHTTQKSITKSQSPPMYLNLVRLILNAKNLI